MGQPPSALTSRPWLMDYGREAAELRALMLEMARTPVLLADHTKFERTAPVRVTNRERVAVVVTDREPKGVMARALTTLSAEILVAGGTAR